MEETKAPYKLKPLKLFACTCNNCEDNRWKLKFGDDSALKPCTKITESCIMDTDHVKIIPDKAYDDMIDAALYNDEELSSQSGDETDSYPHNETHEDDDDDTRLMRYLLLFSSATVHTISVAMTFCKMWMQWEGETWDSLDEKMKQQLLTDLEDHLNNE